MMQALLETQSQVNTEMREELSQRRGRSPSRPTTASLLRQLSSSQASDRWATNLRSVSPAVTKKKITKARKAKTTRAGSQSSVRRKGRVLLLHSTRYIKNCPALHKSRTLLSTSSCCCQPWTRALHRQRALSTSSCSGRTTDRFRFYQAIPSPHTTPSATRRLPSAGRSTMGLTR